MTNQGKKVDLDQMGTADDGKMMSAAERNRDHIPASAPSVMDTSKIKKVFSRPIHQPMGQSRASQMD